MGVQNANSLPAADPWQVRRSFICMRGKREQQYLLSAVVTGRTVQPQPCKGLVANCIVSIDVCSLIHPQPSKLGYRRETGHGSSMFLPQVLQSDDLSAPS